MASTMQTQAREPVAPHLHLGGDSFPLAGPPSYSDASGGASQPAASSAARDQRDDDSVNPVQDTPHVPGQDMEKEAFHSSPPATQLDQPRGTSITVSLALHHCPVPQGRRHAVPELTLLCHRENPYQMSSLPRAKPRQRRSLPTTSCQRSTRSPSSAPPTKSLNLSIHSSAQRFPLTSCPTPSPIPIVLSAGVWL